MNKETTKKTNLFSNSFVKDYKEKLNYEMEQLEGMEMGESKLEAYKKTKSMLVDATRRLTSAVLLRGAVVMALLVVFLVVIHYVENTTIEIVVFAVLALGTIFLISPVFPSPFQSIAANLGKMMKKDGVRYRDCTIKS